MTLEQTLFGASFRTPVLLAAGTCGFGEEIARVVDLNRLGGIVTKSVTAEPRWGNPAPRVTEFPAGMLNSIGLANPGMEKVRKGKLPWIRENLSAIRVFVSVAGHTPDEYVDVVRHLNDEDGFLGFELNLSCPNDTRLGGLPFALDPTALADVVTRVRAITKRPLLAKLAPNAPDFAPIVRAAEESGVDGLTLVNTLPGLAIDPRTRRSVLGAGPGGVSGPALRAVGVHATWRAHLLTKLPILGVGGIATGSDALQYLLAGASLVQVGTASFWDPRAALRVTDQLTRTARREGIRSLSDWIGRAVVGPDPSPSSPPQPPSGGT